MTPTTCRDCRIAGFPGAPGGLVVELCPTHAKAEALARENAELRAALERIEQDFSYLERTYPGVYSTGAGYVLQPRVLEIRAALAPKEVR